MWQLTFFICWDFCCLRVQLCHTALSWEGPEVPVLLTVQLQHPPFLDGLIGLPRKCTPCEQQAHILKRKKFHISLSSVPDTGHTPQTLPKPSSLSLTCQCQWAVSHWAGRTLRGRSPTAAPWQLCSISELSPPGWVLQLAESRAGLHRVPPSQLPKTWRWTLSPSSQPNGQSYHPSAVPRGTWMGEGE